MSTETLELTDSSAALREGVERALSEYLDVDYWHRLESGGNEAVHDPDLWALVSDLAIPTLLLDESRGGADASLLEAHGALEALGALAVPGPAADSMLANWCASRAGLTLTSERATFGPANPQDNVALTRTADGVEVHAGLRAVPFARHIDTLLVQGMLDGEQYLCAIATDADGFKAQASHSLNGEARDDVDIDVRLTSAQIAPAGPVNLHVAGAAMRAVQMAAALNAALDMCIEYVRERQQFGRPLAKFQAIQQQLAVMTALATNAQVGARRAFATLAGPNPEIAVAAAKVAAGQAASQGAAIAHQVHGAMGFTAEYGLHRLTRRLWTWREEYGNEAWWSRQLGTTALTGGADSLWDMIIDEPAA